MILIFSYLNRGQALDKKDLIARMITLLIILLYSSGVKLMAQQWQKLLNWEVIKN